MNQESRKIDLYKKLNQSIEVYKNLQDKQLHSFDTSLMPDLKRFNFERTSAFADLKNRLDLYLNILHHHDEVDTLIFYKKELKQIVEKDSVLKQKIVQYKTELQQHMCSTNKNRSALRRYAGSAGSLYAGTGMV